MEAISIKRIDGVVTLKITGSLQSLSTVGQIYEVLNELIYQEEKLVILDLEKIEMISNCGIGELITLFYGKFRAKGREFVVQAPKDDEAKEKFDNLVLAGLQSNRDLS